MKEMIFQNPMVDEIKRNAFLKERTIYLTEGLGNETELIINRMLEKIENMDVTDGIKPEDARPIKLKISSFGGSVLATLSIISTIESMKDRGYQIHGYAYGACMSGAFKIFIACSKRFAQKYTRLMYHQPHNGQFGISDHADKQRDLQDSEELWEVCKSIIKEYTDITEEMLEYITDAKKDVFLFGRQGLELNIVDELF